MKKASLLNIFFFFSLWSCTLFSSHRTIHIEIPPLPQGLEESCRGIWFLKLISSSGHCFEEELDGEDSLSGSLDVEWPKEEDLLILLTPPEWSAGIRPFPWGAYIPADSVRGTLSYRAGAPVQILSRVIGAGGDLTDFNCPRFLEEMGELKDPWLVDHDLLVRQLGRREMRSWYIRAAPLFSLSLPLPEGPWYSQFFANDFLISSGGTGESVDLELPEGYACFFNPVSSTVAELQVDDHGEAVWMLSAGGSFHSTGLCPVCSR